MNDETLQPLPESSEPSHEVAEPEKVRAAIRQARKVRARRRIARREACFELLSAGYSHEQIARRLKVSAASVRRDVAHVLDERRLDAPERYIHFQVDRLTRALRSMDDLVERGDSRAVKPFISLVGALDRYHGLDARYRREPSFLSAPDAAAPLALAAPADFSANVAEPDTQVLEKARA